MAHILILYAGGTIGMAQTPDGLQTTSADTFLDHLRQSLGSISRPLKNLGSISRPLKSLGSISRLPTYDCYALTPLLDSSNMSPNDWTRLTTQLKNLWSHADGFVILHGTDTMAYTAAGLSCMIQYPDKPIILTGSQIPLIQQDSDAIDNVRGALCAAATPYYPGVSIYFGGRLLYGDHVRKVHSTDKIAFAGRLRDTSATHIIKPIKQRVSFLMPSFTDGTVALVSLFPGQGAAPLRHILSDQQIRGVIMESYGTGNIPNDDQTFMTLLSRIIKRGVVCVNITQCQDGGVHDQTYATGQAASGLGLINGRHMTREYAVAQLQVLCARHKTPKDIKMALSLYFTEQANGDASPENTFSS